MEIGIPLTVRVGNEVHRSSVHRDGDVSPVIGIEAPKENLLGLAPAGMLRDHQAWDEAKQLLG